MAFHLKQLLDDPKRQQYRQFDELRDIMTGTVFFLAITLVLVPIEVWGWRNQEKG